MGDMLKKIKHMQEEMKRVQAELREETYKATAEGVSCTVSGDMEVREIKIDPAVLQKADASKLEALVGEAVTSAMHEAKSVAKGKLGRLTGGLSIPGMF